MGDAARVGRGDLAVEHDPTAELGEIGEDWAKEPAAVVSVPRQQTNVTATVAA
jgi:hypothetical protein